MREFSSKTRSLIITGSIGCLVLLYAFLVFLPIRRAIEKMRVELDEKRQFILAAQNDFTEIGAIQVNLRRTEQWVDDWKSRSPRTNNLGGFFGRIAEISRVVGTQIERITPEELSQMNVVSRHPVRLVVGGSFDQLFEFVHALEQMPFTVWVDRIQLQPVSQNSEQLTCEISLAVFTDNPGLSD